MRNAQFNGHLYRGGVQGMYTPCPIACWDTPPPPKDRQTPVKILPSRKCCGQLLSYSINLFIFHPILAQDNFFSFQAIFSLILSFFKDFWQSCCKYNFALLVEIEQARVIWDSR